MNSIFLPIFENMPSVNPEIKLLETLSFPSEKLGRNLRIDFYLPPDTDNGPLDVLLINDGQDLQTMHLESILARLYRIPFHTPATLYWHSCRYPPEI